MEPFIGQIEIFAFDFPPKSWATCAGQLMPINQYQALFSLLGTTYGGDGVRTFALPDLRGRVPMGQGSSSPGLTARTLGQTVGEANHTLTSAEMPAHSHPMAASTNALGNVASPGGRVLGQTLGKKGTAPLTFLLYGSTPADQSLAPSALATSPGQPHANQMPSLTLNFCIALSGIFPSRS